MQISGRCSRIASPMSDVTVTLSQKPQTSQRNKPNSDGPVSRLFVEKRESECDGWKSRVESRIYCTCYGVTDRRAGSGERDREIAVTADLRRKLPSAYR